MYKQAAVNWTVTLHKGITGVEFNENDDPRLDDETTVFTAYTKEMRNIIDSYEELNNTTDKTYVLFLMHSSEKNKAGFMPLKKHYGFIFMDEFRSSKPEELHRTVSHEVAHGAFVLYHTFSEFPALQQGTTDNLMDYTTGTRLCKYQWDLIHDPVWLIVGGGSEEEGAYYVGNISMQLKNTEFSEENKVNIYIFIDESKRTSLAYHGNGGSRENIAISLKPYFEPKEDNTANGFYARIKVYTDDAKTPHFEGDPKRVRKPLLGGDGLYSPRNDWEFELTDKVGFYPDFKIEYYASLTEDGEYEKMDEYNGMLYMTFKMPVFGTVADNRLDERLLYFGCKNSNGTASEKAVIDSIWAKFEIKNNEAPLGSLYQRNFNPNLENVQLGYYLSHQNNHISYSGLLTLGGHTGECGAFVDLLESLLLLQGIQCTTSSFSPLNDADRVFLIKNWNFIGDGTSGNPIYPYINKPTNAEINDPERITVNSVNNRLPKGQYGWIGTPEVIREEGVPGQGNKSPFSDFNIHHVLKVNNTYYDPSYGKTFNSLYEWENHPDRGVTIGFIRLDLYYSGDGSMHVKYEIRKNDGAIDFKEN